MTTLATSFRQVVAPKEHGSWSLALEPIALGLLVAPSLSGAWLALAVVAGFFLRRPLKTTWLLAATEPRRFAAATWATVLCLIALTSLCAIAQPLAADAFSAIKLWPLSVAAPLGLVFLWFDLRNDMREAEAEIAGSATFAVLPAAFASLAGWPVSAALALAALMLARSVPTVLAVRALVRRRKGQSVSIFPALATALATAALALTVIRHASLPTALAALPLALCARTVWFSLPFAPTWSAKRIGIFEAILGAAYVAAALIICSGV